MKKWPTWDQFTSGLKIFEQKLSDAEFKGIEYIKKFQDRHPILDGMIQGGIKSLPPPLNEITQGIYNKASNSIEGSIQVYEYLKNLESLGQAHYDSVMAELKDIRVDMAKEETQIQIKNILVSTGDVLKEKLELLRTMNEKLDGLGEKMDDMNSTLENVKQNSGSVNSPNVTGNENEITIIHNYYGDDPSRPTNPKESEIVKDSSFSKQLIIANKTKNFVGRQNFIDQIKNLMEPSNQPITIVGEAGLGKSQLALKAIDRFQKSFSYSIQFDFTNFIGYEKLLTDFASYLDLPMGEFDRLGTENKTHVILDTLSKLEHVLIYADNFETVSSLLLSDNDDVNTLDAKLIIKLLQSVPNNTLVITTSRIRKNLDGERLVELDGLSKAEGGEMFVKLAQNYFSKELSMDMKSILEEISEKTGGHPLSIELLARSYKGNGIQELQKMLEYLGVGVINPREDGRLKSLDKCFEFSIHSLDKNNAKLLPKLSIFASYFTPQGAQEILGINHDALQEFYDYGLLRRIDFDEDNPLEFRLYGFHLATKNYLQKQIDLKSLELEVCKSFVNYYEKLAKGTFDSLSNEYRVPSINRFKTMMQGENDFDVALIQSGMVVSSMYSNLGWILKSLGNLSGALEYAKKALTINEKNGNESGMSTWYNNTSIILNDQGKLDEALKYVQKALAISEKNNDEVSMAIDYNTMGQVLKDKGDLDGALQYTQKGLAISEKNNDEVNMAIRYNNIGMILKAKGDLDGALQYVQKALAISEKNNDEVSMAIRYSNIGQILRSKGDLDGALQYVQKALAISEKNNDEVKMILRYNNIGMILKAKGDLDGALQYVQKALAISEKNNDEVKMILRYNNIGYILQVMKKESEAQKYFKKASEIKKRLGQ